jgi:hypothetical protein
MAELPGTADAVELIGIVVTKIYLIVVQIQYILNYTVVL